MSIARPTAADRRIGMRIQERRLMSGLTQRELGELVGVTGAVIRRYETGENSVSAARLYVIAQELSTPIEYFFEDLEQDERKPPPHQRMLFDVVRNFGEVQNEKCLEAINDFIRALAGR
jgi:transcriptional regulator with XRE-family HTH domain